MSFKRYPKNDFVLKSSSYLQEKEGVEFANPELKPHDSLQFSTPQQVPPRKGRTIVALIILGALCYGSYLIWNTYFRYESFGVVAANIIGVYAPNPGFIDALKVTEGDRVQRGLLVARVVNTNDLRSLMKIEDEIEMVRTEAQSKESEIRWSLGRNNNAFYQAQAELAEEEGELSELRTNLDLQKINLNRIQELNGQGAVSQLDLDRARADVAGTAALITGKVNMIAALKDRVESLKSTISDDGSAQLLPIKKKLKFLTNEKSRLEQRIAEGNIVSPINGIVSSIQRYAGERVDGDSIFLMVEDDTTKLVLYYNPAARVPVLGEHIDVWSPSLNRTITTVVSAISKDTVEPPNQIKRNYSADDKLVRVYLKPVDADINSFIVGSIIKRPNVFDLLTEAAKISSGASSEEVK